MLHYHRHSGLMYGSPDLAYRVYDSPGPRVCYDLMAGYTLEYLAKQFFNDTPYLKEYVNASWSKQGVAWSCLLFKIKNILWPAFSTREAIHGIHQVRMPTRKRRYLSVVLRIWLGRSRNDTRPYTSTNGKDYLPYDRTVCAENGEPRTLDDYQPQKQLKS